MDRNHLKHRKESKVMEAPEKIWINSYQDLPCSNVDGNSIEYTRTDAFIDKVCEWLEKNIAELTGIDSYAITESFKQAMEE